MLGPAIAQRFQELTRRRYDSVQLTAQLAAAEARAQEFARDIETNLLIAFHGHAKGQTARVHTVEVTASDLALRVAALEDRMLNVETRRHP